MAVIEGIPRFVPVADFSLETRLGMTRAEFPGAKGQLGVESEARHKLFDGTQLWYLPTTYCNIDNIDTGLAIFSSIIGIVVLDRVQRASLWEFLGCIPSVNTMAPKMSKNQMRRAKKKEQKKTQVSTPSYSDCEV